MGKLAQVLETGSRANPKLFPYTVVEVARLQARGGDSLSAKHMRTTMQMELGGGRLGIPELRSNYFVQLERQAGRRYVGSVCWQAPVRILEYVVAKPQPGRPCVE